MHSFEDTEGRTWNLAITFGSIKRAKDLLGVNLLNPLATRKYKTNGRARRSQPLLTRLQLDPALLVDLIFALLRPQAEQQGVTDEQFAEALGGEAAYEAYRAFMEEWQVFFHGLRREAEARAIRANKEMIEAETAKNVELVEKATETAGRLTARKREEAMAKLESVGRGASPTVTGSLESSESTQGH